MNSHNVPSPDLCLCVHYGCRNHIDIASGQRGVPLNPRQMRVHEAKDREDRIQALVEPREKFALRKADDELVLATHGLSMNDLPPAATRQVRKSQQGNYAIERVAKIVQEFGAIIDESDGLIASASALNIEDSTAADEHIKTKLVNLNCQRVELESRLSMLSKRSKDPAVVATQQTAIARVRDLKDVLQQHEATLARQSQFLHAAHKQRLNSGIPEYNSDDFFVSRISGLKPVIQLVLTMVVACHIIFGLPRRGCDWLFSMCRYILETTLGRIYSTNIPPYFENILHGFPLDLHAAIETFNIKTKETIYAVCPNPECHATYKPEYDGHLRAYPLRCTHRKYKSRCGQLLVRQKRIGDVFVNIPIKTYITFDFDHWMAELMSRPGYEKVMDAAWGRMVPREDGLITDVFQGSVIRNFLGPGRTMHFSKYRGEEAGHYLFSLGFDFFNPGRNQHGGKPVSIGAISLVCLNLPIEIRYKVENIFLAGVVPGPKEPPLDCINPYLRPLVDALLLFWTGVWFTSTSTRKSGRLVLCAIIMVVCDLLGARKVGGFAAPTATRFCTVCHCHRSFKSPHNDKDIGYDNYDVGSWQLRTTRNWLKHADKWHRCGSDKERKASVDRNGVRWSELLRLPYYEPSRFLVVDPMHNLFLGLIHEHFRGIFGYRPRKHRNSNSKAPPRPGSGVSPDNHPGRLPPIELTLNSGHVSPTEDDLLKVKKLLEHLQLPIASRTRQEVISRIDRRGTLPAMIYVGQGLGCVPADVDRNGVNLMRKKVVSKRTAAEALANWRISCLQPGDRVGVDAAPAGSDDQPNPIEHAEPTLAAPQPYCLLGSERGNLFTADEMEAIWDDFENIITPSWITSITRSFLASGPSLKSDQWRMVGSLYLPLTLTRLWGRVDPTDGRSIRRHDYLDLTMCLASAVLIATSRVTSGDHAQQYLAYMIQYRRKLRDLFPEYRARCNHHMALHLPQFMEMYGPVHGWWTFPTERMNGMLQRILTNHQFDENGETVARTWHRTVAFRAAILKIQDSEFVKGIRYLFERLLRSHSSNSLSDSGHDFDEYERTSDFKTFSHTEHPLSPTNRDTLTKRIPQGLPEKVHTAAYLSYQGKTYSVRSRHEGNSNIFTRIHGVPTQIESILRFPDSQDIWLLVRKRKPIQGCSDPFKKYPFLRTRLWSREYDTELEAVHITEVDTHFAALDMIWEGRNVTAIALLSPNLYIQRQGA